MIASSQRPKLLSGAPSPDRIGAVCRVTGLFLATAALAGRAMFPSEDADSGSGVELLLLEMFCGVCWALERWRNGCRLRTSGLARWWCLLLAWLWMTVLAAAYRFPAFVLAWEWTGAALVVLYLLQVAEDRSRRAFATLLVGLVLGQSLLAWWQATVTFPELRRMYQRQDPALMEALRETLGIDPNSPEAITVQSRLLHSTEPYGTFGLPNSLAGFLVLGLPMLLATWKPRRDAMASLLWITACAAVVGALVLTKSRSAWLAVFLIGGAAGCLAGRSVIRRHWRLLAIGALLLGVLVAALAAGGLLDRLVLTEATKSLGYRLEWWRASAHVLAERPVLGVGLGNFGDHYLRYKLPFSSEEIRDPHNFAIELWCNAGLLALVAYLGALGCGLLGTLRPVLPNESGDNGPELPGLRGSASSLPRWWFAGAGGGILYAAVVELGLGSAVAQAFRGDFTGLLAFGGWSTIVCMGIGLAAAALLGLPLERRRLRLGCGIGALALHLHWLAAGSTNYPVLLMTCWAGLAVGSGRPVSPTARSRLDGCIVLLTFALCSCFVWSLFWPLLQREQIHRSLRSITEPSADRLIEGYRAAALRVPADQEGWLRLALLHAARLRLEKIANRHGEYAAAQAAFQQALALAPQRSSAYQLLGRLHTEAAARGLDELARQRATVAFQYMVERYPHSASRRWELANALLAEGSAARAAEEFRHALWLDQTPHLDKRLTPEQRALARFHAGR